MTQNILNRAYSNFQQQITKLADFFKEDITNDIFDELKCFREVYGNIFCSDSNYEDLQIGQVFKFYDSQ